MSISALAAAPAIFGFNFVCWSSGCFDAAPAQKSLSDLADTGAAWVAVVQTRYMARRDAGAIEPGDTASEDGLRRAIRRAKARGLKVALKPHVDVRDLAVRALIDPKDAESWWRDYDAYVLHYAGIASQEGCDLFVVGTELALMTRYHRRWTSLIARARKIYKGPLTYAANWYDYPAVPFWGALDYIGIDGYFPLADARHRWAMKAAWGLWKAPLAAQAMASGKPVLFTEFGCSSQRGANLKPWEWNRLGPVDLALQRDYYETFLESFAREPWFAGVLVWGWDDDPSSGGPDSFGLTVQGKPALDVLKTYFARWRGGPALAPPPPPGLTAQQREELGRRATSARENVARSFGGH